jgi:hypothetical protein
VYALADASRPVPATHHADRRATHLRDALTGERIPVRDGRVELIVAGARVLRPEP